MFIILYNIHKIVTTCRKVLRRHPSYILYNYNKNNYKKISNYKKTYTKHELPQPEGVYFEKRQKQHHRAL